MSIFSGFSHENSLKSVTSLELLKKLKGATNFWDTIIIILANCYYNFFRRKKYTRRFSTGG